MIETATVRAPRLPRRLSICLINPKFEPSFWGYDFALPLMPGDKRCWVTTGALPALAALAPPHCDVTLLDENVTALDLEALARFDVIGITGMVVQGARMHEILAQVRPLGATLAVGGPYVSVAETAFEGLCDVRFVGEAEETWPAFLNALAAGEPVAPRYQQAEKTDMRTVPAPRYDLVDAERYLMASLQFSRGCPFTCEFCDIITIFGRRPRLKSVEQMLVEIAVVHRAGFRLCFLVDDNLIGNKRGIRPLLAALGEWQAANGYPLQLFAEASIDLAEDVDLIEMMVRANVRQIFVGIESPRTASLAETRKNQNIRSRTLESRVQTIRDGGLVVQAGFIVGFDSDDEGIFQDQFDFIQRAGIAQALVAILSPIPTTPLYDRLAAEGRLDFSDPDVAFRPAQLSQAALKTGYDALMHRLYEPRAYFERLFVGYRESPAFRARRRAMDALAKGRGGLVKNLWRTLGTLRQAWGLYRAIAAAGRRRLALAYLRAWTTWNRPLGWERMPLPAFVGLCVVHWHFFNIANRPRKGDFGVVFSASRPERPAADAPVASSG